MLRQDKTHSRANVRGCMGQMHLSAFSLSEWVLLILWFAAVIAPIAYSYRNKTPVALGISVGLLLGYIVQYTFVVLRSYGFELEFVWFDFWLIPVRLDSPIYYHTMFTAGFLHSMTDVTHVLGNVLVIALVGIPLEQRLGTKRFTMIYVAGLLGGSLAWVYFNSGSQTPSWGASGAAYGLLGAYLAGWPKDEIPFPLILIRPWPVTVIALFYFGFELIRAFNTVGLGGYSTVAHMAHIGGFVLAYALVPLVAKGGPYPLGVIDGGPKGFGNSRAGFEQMKSSMVDLSNIDDPWTELGLEVPKKIREPLRKLKEAGDEAETRIAWMEHIAEAGDCPVCLAPLGMVERRTGPQIQCSKEPKHLAWPK